MYLQKAIWLPLMLFYGLTISQFTPDIIQDLKLEPPKPVPKYMVDNTGNKYAASPDKGVINGPSVHSEFLSQVGNSTNVPHLSPADGTVPRLGKGNGKRDGGFWMGSVTHGQSPFADAAGNYKVFRNVKVRDLLNLASYKLQRHG